MQALPPPCEEGSRVGVVATSGPVKGPQLRAGIAQLRSWGLVPVVYLSLIHI